MYYQDFAGGIPNGWSVVNRVGNSNNWIWANTAPGGQYSTSTPVINSTSSGNGFMSIPADFYNTPFPTNGPVIMDTWFVSNALSIAPKSNIEIKWEQSGRFCCGSTNDFVLEVSTDSINWTTYDALRGRANNIGFPSSTSAPAEQVNINVSTVLANEDTAYVRFRMTGATHYYWMIDDVVLTEGISSNMAIDKFELGMNPSFPIKPYYSMVIQNVFPPLKGLIYTSNQGFTAQNQLTAELKVVQDSTLVGNPGQGTVWLNTQTKTSPTLYLDLDTFSIGNYYNYGTGYYRAIASITGSTPNTSLPNAVEIPFIVSDTVMARDFNEFNVNTGPYQFQGGGNNGDRLGLLYNLEKNNIGFIGEVLSMSYFIANDSANIGVSIKPMFWNYDSSKTLLNNAISTTPFGSSPFSTTLTSNHLGTWVSVPLFPPVSMCNNNGQYVVGLEQVGGSPSNRRITLGRDTSAEKYSVDFSSFVYINNSTPTWSWTNHLPGIRLNLAPYGCTSGLAENENQNFKIYPNPSNGIFSLRLKTEKAKQYTLKVRNNLGQIVLEEQVFANGNFAKAIDLSENESGVYFLSLENEKERLIEKIIVQ